MNKISKWIKIVLYIFLVVGYYLGNDFVENSKYIWKIYGIKKVFVIYIDRYYFNLIYV